MTDNELLTAFGNARILFWVCPVKGHSESRTDESGRPVVTVDWRGDVAHCTYPDCGRTSADHALVLVRDEQRKRGWYLSWRCTRKGCDVRGNSTTPTRERGIQLLNLLTEAHLTWADPGPDNQA